MWLDSIQWTSIKPGCCRLIHLHLLLKNQLMQLSFLYLLQIYKNQRPRKVRSLAWCYRNSLSDARIQVLHAGQVSYCCSTSSPPGKGQAPEKPLVSEKGNFRRTWQAGQEASPSRHGPQRDNEYVFLCSLILDDPVIFEVKGSFEEKLSFLLAIRTCSTCKTIRTETT